LNGPTNNVWLHPWLEYLQSKGVEFRFSSTVTRLDCEDGVISGVWVQQTGPGGELLGQPERHGADQYILAVPVEVAAPLIIGDLLKPDQTVAQFLKDVVEHADLNDPEVSILDVIEDAAEKAAIVKADRTLAGVIELASDVSWMTGVQFFLNEEVTLNDGHIIFSDSPWAVTAIAQSNFWKGFPMSSFSDGKVKTVLSCDVSEWDNEGLLFGKIAKACTPEEIKLEVWTQMERSLVMDGKPMLNKSMIHASFIDRDIKFTDGDHFSENREPLLVNKVDTWRLRPESYCAIPNLYFAADYVRTHTDLATMEGANEAARRAVNTILERTGSPAEPCRIWDLHEPWLLQPYREHDHERYRKGLPWRQDFPWWVKLAHKLTGLFKHGAKPAS
jgi:15-cis-phytoene desaturase